MTKRSGTAILACSAVILLAASDIQAAGRSRSGSSLRSVPESEAPHKTGVARAEPSSWAEFRKLIRDGQLTEADASKFVGPNTASGAPGTMRVLGAGAAEIHPREPLPCGQYTDFATFDADHGPFDRANGNYEDMELTNPPVGSLCIIDSLELMDCTDSGPDPTGFFCAGPAVDAGDILTGLAVDSTPQRGAGWWEGLVTGSGFSGYPTKAFLPNYFGDTLTIDFPNSGAPAGCENPSPGPNVVGMTLWHNNTTPNATVYLELADGTVVENITEGLDSNGDFYGYCCTQEIVHVDIEDTGNAQTVGVDEIAWGPNVADCPESFPPLTLEDIHDSLEVLEVKLDTLDCTGGTDSGGKCTFCAPVLDDIAEDAKNHGTVQSLRSKLTAACQAFQRGQVKTSGNILCATLSHIDAQEGQGLDPDDADALRDCILDTASTNDIPLGCL